MKNLLITLLLLTSYTGVFSQTPGYYNGTEEKNGVELKAALHNIIKGHVDFSYSDAKYILNYADEDPNNTDNLIQFYTNRSVSKDAWGTDGDQTNREHIWAKSHGNFADIRPMDGDAHNLHAADASVNVIRSNSDFDNVTDGTYIEEADAYYKGEAFEPADRDKGAVARTIFYMAVRYEGTDNEMDLEVVDQIDTYPNPTHGKLSTLLEWNRNFPPTTFEKRRNERVNLSQRNRNPFIDNPGFADLIWGSAQVSGTTISDVSMEPEHPMATDDVTITATFTNSSETPTAILYWGSAYDSETYSMAFAGTNTMQASIDLSTFADNDLVYSKIVTSDGVVRYNSFYVAPNKTITPISEVQGTGSASPISGQEVTISGIVTANLDNSFYMQSGHNKYSGICIYSTWRGHIGDSVTVTGKVTEYQNLTELGDVTLVYSYGLKDTLDPVNLSVNEISEAYEGMLIQLTGVNFSNADELIPAGGGTYTITEGSSTIPVYVRYNSRLCGQKIPNGTVNVMAIVSQYQGNYQLLIDNIGWIEQGIDITAPEITDVKVTDASFIEISFNEKIDQNSVTAEAFSIDGVTITDAYYYPSTQVYLLVSGIKKQEYTLVVNGVKDLYGNTTSNASFNFTSGFSKVTDFENTNNLQVSPNPNTGDFIIRLNNKITENTQLVIYDLSGRVVLKSNVIQGVKEIPITLNKNITKGYYFIQLRSINSNSTTRIIIE